MRPLLRLICWSPRSGGQTQAVHVGHLAQINQQPGVAGVYQRLRISLRSCGEEKINILVMPTTATFPRCSVLSCDHTLLLGRNFAMIKRLPCQILIVHLIHHRADDVHPQTARTQLIERPRFDRLDVRRLAQIDDDNSSLIGVIRRLYRWLARHIVIGVADDIEQASSTARMILAHSLREKPARAAISSIAARSTLR